MYNIMKEAEVIWEKQQKMQVGHFVPKMTESL